MTSFALGVGLCSVAAVVAASACTSTAAPASPSTVGTAAPPPAGRIVVLGDSLAVSPSRSDNFPAELQKRLASTGSRWTVTNAGVSGDRSSDGVRRVDAVLTSDTRILILELGANDGLRGVAIPTIERNLATIIERAQARGVRVILCGMEVPPAHGWDYTVAFHRLFPRLASRYNVPLVPFLLAGVALNADFNGDDGIHPNAAGAQRIADTVWSYLEAVIRQESAPAT